MGRKKQLRKALNHTTKALHRLERADVGFLIAPMRLMEYALKKEVKEDGRENHEGSDL